jgi:hypothetical protein
LSAPDLIVQILKNAGVISDRYTGQVILHIGTGSLCNVEMREKPKGSEYYDRLCGMNERIFLTTVSDCAKAMNNSI